MKYLSASRIISLIRRILYYSSTSCIQHRMSNIKIIGHYWGCCIGFCFCNGSINIPSNGLGSSVASVRTKQKAKNIQIAFKKAR